MDQQNPQKAEMGVEGLHCYQKAIELLKLSYSVAARLPKYETYNLASQIRRAALSGVLNIAEGYGRYHYLEKLRFFYIARGSLSEVRAAFSAAQAVGYIQEAQMKEAHSIETAAQRSLDGFVAFIRRQQQGHKEFGDAVVHEPLSEYLLDLGDQITDH
ncbi:MAG: four helix bundle protein [Anaerolineae bacterium]|nr:four helix bundle protein [Anaerolineae bacterium]